MSDPTTPETPDTPEGEEEVPAVDVPAGADLGPAAPTWVPDVDPAVADTTDTSAASDDTATPDRDDPAADGPGADLVEPEDTRSPAELRAELAEAEARRDEYLDDLRRARAEFENYRRRTAKEAAAARDTGRGDVVTALLDVLDDLDRTLEAAEGSADETLAKGVSLVADKLVSTLRGLGLSRIDEPGAAFDPAVHEAVQQVEADPPVEEPVVERTLRPGYQLGDRVLRPAMVVVAG